MDMLEVRNVGLTYNDFVAIDDLTFTLEQGKTYGLLGRNGAGKTSILSLIAAFQLQTKGTIKLNKASVFENPESMQKISFVYDQDYSEETEKVKKLLEATKKYRPYFDQEYADYLIKKFKLPLNKPVKNLSKGMQSAFNVTVGLASRSPITIFDESYLGMDVPTREIFYEEILKEQGENPRIIILSTHLVSEMDHLFDEVLVVHKGSLIVKEQYEDLISKGVHITGNENSINKFIQGYKVIHEQKLGGTKSALIYGSLTEQDRELAKKDGLQLNPATLQELFTHLTKEKGDEDE
ncbi:ATP-binding cassette domain-containing protein [Alkalibacillus haloalkaliphilus]|uniref:ABC transporter n=1 Tax=Alkalibacillus haloalkaliphilus TaxID=94136 RepID=A0A511W6L3_9BACI|nr:ABC transporter ATP-binding protein [Alkalibacillus haloalkaliphilus]GEN46371.1 ABC transporter [Alkalibacillus haloalkaliphilus]